MSFNDHPDHEVIQQLADEEVTRTGQPLSEESAAVLRSFLSEQSRSIHDADATTLGVAAVESVVQRPEGAMAVHSGYENGRRA